jgi:hypothetical protein
VHRPIELRDVGALHRRLEIERLDEQPLVEQREVPLVGRTEENVAVAPAQMEQNRVRFVEDEIVVAQHGNAAVRVSREKVGLLVRPLHEIDELVRIGDADLLERPVDLARVGRVGVGEELDHADPLPPNRRLGTEPERNGRDR